MQPLLGHGLLADGVTTLTPEVVRERMDACFATAVTAGRSVVVVACELRVRSSASSDDEARLLAGLGTHFAQAVQPDELLAFRTEEGAVCLLVGVELDAVQDTCKGWLAGLRARVTPGAVRVGLGLGRSLEGKALWLETLIRVARQGAQIARCRGGGSAVHTMLYDFVQRQLEHEPGRAPAPLAAARKASTPVTLEVVPTPAPSAPPAPEPKAAPQAAARTASTDAAPIAEQRPQDDDVEAIRRENGELKARLRILESMRSANPDERIELLERRILKLASSLEATDQRLTQVASARVEDVGIASRFKSPQGISPGDAGYETKSGLMSAIFEANLALKHAIEASEGGPSPQSPN